MWGRPGIDSPKSRKAYTFLQGFGSNHKNETKMQTNLKTGHTKSNSTAHT
jgi:hypothetical protein